ncbi:MAG: DNA polymerase III subunit delta [Actinomycetes bacterium]
MLRLVPALDEPPPVVLVTGPEALLADRAVAAVLDAARAAATRDEAGATTRVEAQRVPAAELEPGDVTALTSPSLFGERRVLVLEGVQDAAKTVLEEVAAYVMSPEPEVVLVLTHSGTTKGTSAVDAARAAGAQEVTCPKITRPGDRVRFVREEFAAAGRSLGEPAARALIDAVGNDLRELANACDQLISDTEGTVDEDVVARYYRGRAEVTSFQVADAAVEGRTVDALSQLRWLLALGDPRSPLGVVVALAQGLRQVVRVAEAPRNARPADLARELGMPPWKVDRVRKQVHGWTPDAVATAVRAVAVADERLKTGADKAYTVERAVVDVSQARRAR